ncbi:MAG: hypothetical protein ACXAC7_19770 [Candidatus Hodarchaeales archaeon]|jgi:hypothetical protein
MIIDLKQTNSLQDLFLKLGNLDQQKPLELFLRIFLGSNIELSFIDDTILLIEGENCEIRMDISKSDLKQLKI